MRKEYYSEEIGALFDDRRLEEIPPLCADIISTLPTDATETQSDTALLLDHMARAYYELGDYQSALEATKRVVRIDCLDVANIADCSRNLFNLGRLYRLLGERSASEEALKRSLEMLSDLPETQQWAGALVQVELALVLSDQGRFVEAEGLLFQALKARMRSYGQIHPLIAEVFFHLSSLYKRTGKPFAAERAIRKAKRIRGSSL
jgi:tetratricopeptide (TPR) repeat protein